MESKRRQWIFGWSSGSCSPTPATKAVMFFELVSVFFAVKIANCTKSRTTKSLGEAYKLWFRYWAVIFRFERHIFSGNYLQRKFVLLLELCLKWVFQENIIDVKWVGYNLNWIYTFFSKIKNYFCFNSNYSIFPHLRTIRWIF